MKLAPCLCFLALAVSSASRAQNQTATSLQGTKNSTDSPLHTPTTLLPPSDAPPDVVVPTATANRANETQATTGNKADYGVTEEVSSAATTATTVPGSPVSIATSSDSESDKPERPFSGGYVILVLIVLAIVVLCGVLFFLRRASRTYSFDLQRPPPASRLGEPTGTFELVNLDDLDQLAKGEQVTLDDLSASLNGVTLLSEEKAPNGQTDAADGAINATPQEEPDANRGDASSSSSTRASTGDDPVEKASDRSSGLMDSPGKEEQNEADNPPAGAGEPFIEINLEEAALSEPSATPPESPSSVLPSSSSPTSSLTSLPVISTHAELESP